MKSLYKLVCAVPFDGFEKGWETEWQERYHQILREADEVYYLSVRYARGVYQKRNEWMIDHASMVIAGYTGAAGRDKKYFGVCKGTGRIYNSLFALGP